MPTARHPRDRRPHPVGRRASPWHAPARAVAVSAALLGLAGCGSSGGAASSGTSVTTSGSVTPAVGTSTSSTSAPTSSDTSTSEAATTSTAGAGGLPKDHSVCVLIDFTTATSILGGKPTTLKIPDTSDDMVTHVDRCNWTAPGGSLAYQVNRYANPAMGATVVRGITGHLPPAALALDFPPSGKGFVVDIGPKAMGRAIVPLSGVVLDLTTTAPSPDKAKALLQQLADTLTHDLGG